VKLDNLYYAGSHGMDIMAPSLPVTSSAGEDIDIAKSVSYSVLTVIVLDILRMKYL